LTKMEQKYYAVHLRNYSLKLKNVKKFGSPD
jgi:hypothetical protein